MRSDSTSPEVPRHPRPRQLASLLPPSLCRASIRENRGWISRSVERYSLLTIASPPDELEASPAGSRSDDYVLAFLWFSAPPPPKLRTILVCCCCSSWPGLPEPPSLRSKTKQGSQCFRALPASENSPPFTGEAGGPHYFNFQNKCHRNLHCSAVCCG